MDPIIKYTEINSKGQITIPDELNLINAKEGDKVVLITYDDRVEIRTLKNMEELLENAT